MKFTDEQLKIINHSGGHARVSAVAGSGKTTTMVARLGFLLEHGVAADKILVLMFNRSARDAFEQAMQARLGQLRLPLPEVRTFHSLGLRLVGSFGKRGVLPAYRLVTEDYVIERLARRISNELYRQFTEEAGYLSTEDVEEFIAYIDLVKSTTASPEHVFRGLELSSKFSFFPQAYKTFEDTRKKQNLRFYADLIHEPLMAMLNDDSLRSWVTDRVDHIIVDEYQDINDVQQQLLKILAGTRARVMVVGDVDQCIYEWRGAKPEYINTVFSQDFPEPVNYQLSSTFRYGHQLALAANHLISNNLRRDDKLCISHEGNGLTILQIMEQTSGVHPVLGVLDEWQKSGRKLSEAVVLVRLFAQSVPVELALLEKGIPYRIEGGADVFDCAEIRALRGYLHTAAGSFGLLEADTRFDMLCSMLALPHLGINRDDIETLAGEISPDVRNSSALLLAWSERDFAPFIKKRFLEASENWQWLQQYGGEKNAASFLRLLVERLNIYDFFHSFSVRAATAENKIKTCEAFIDFAGKGRLSILDFLAKLDGLHGDAETQVSDSLLITSVHRAKGLEWPLVILPGLEDGSFPFLSEKKDEPELEDERRLFYVAMTRAIEKLVCIHPPDAKLKQSIRSNLSKCTEQYPQASRFLYEMNPGFSSQLGSLIASGGVGKTVHADDITIGQLYQQRVGTGIPMSLVKRTGGRRGGNFVARKREAPKKYLKAGQFSEGMAVVHPIFGRGVVTTIRDKKQGQLIVSFPEHGEILLLAAYAKLQAA